MHRYTPAALAPVSSASVIDEHRVTANDLTEVDLGNIEDIVAERSRKTGATAAMDDTPSQKDMRKKQTTPKAVDVAVICCRVFADQIRNRKQVSISGSSPPPPFTQLSIQPRPR